MYQIRVTFLGIIFIFLNFISNGQNSNPLPDVITVVAPGAKLNLVSNQFSFTEGPAVDKKGNIFFTDQPNDKIWEYHTNGRLSLFMEKTGRSNGMFFDKKGNLNSCADEKDELWSINKKKKVTVLVTNFRGHRLNGPNDLWIDPKGGIYFTDPYYQRDYWKRKKPDINGQYVYYLPKGNKNPFIVDSLLIKPNGIIGTKNGKYLYVADIQGDKTYKYQIQKDGTLANKQLFVSQGSDGMTIDNEGNIYLSGHGITVYNNTGTKIGFIPVPAKWVGNICFGGRGKNILFITASEAVYTLQMKVKGVE
ncbi:MAG TPA: SMP-30/gluconolactonase/LRE family protein [Hanamia sp.]|nr:SMP-30/gluconolactonase/LRE family protein [Hanamia sp.]